MEEQVKSKSWGRHAQLAFRKRWVQVCLLGMIWLFTVLLTVAYMAPNSPAKGAAKDTSGFRFLHCDVCKMELPYNKEMDGKRCPKCVPPKTGFFFPTEQSIRTGSGSLSPWRYVFVAVCIESVVLLGITVRVLSAPIFDPKAAYYILPCPHCNQRLRYRGVSLGSLGSCSRCKRVLRFPAEEEAMLEADVQKLEEEVAKIMSEQAMAEAEAAEDAKAQAEYEAALKAEAEALALAEAETQVQAEADAEAAALAAAEARAARKARKRAKRNSENV